MGIGREEGRARGAKGGGDGGGKGFDRPEHCWSGFGQSVERRPVGGGGFQSGLMEMAVGMPVGLAAR
eukprot:6044162-Pleurochrysis_carterae.AAC.1